MPATTARQRTAPRPNGRRHPAPAAAAAADEDATAAPPLTAVTAGREPLQLLTPDGKPVPHPHLTPERDPAALRRMYRDMVLTRAFDAEATALQRQGELGLWTPLAGQEAAQIGSAHALRPDDFVFPSYREHGVAWCRGVDPVSLVSIFRGVTHGGWDPAAHNFHLYTLVVGAHPLHATGYAMGVARDGADSAVIAYFGDGASSQGDVAEAFTFAAVNQAPVVFFCQNNQWAISVPAERQSRVPLYQRAQGYGFPGVRVDGNDVLAVQAVTRAALERARSGRGPVLIEAFTYRMGAHTTSDDPTRYRMQAELAEWQAKDPVQRLRRHLERLDAADAAFFTATEEDGRELARSVRTAVRTMPDPEPSVMFEHIHAAGHRQVDAERAWFAAYQDGFAPEEDEDR
ncbi:pyruvate dehydrogenase (acetyl-transferring) E1 component subunit alpha [Streptomyces aidingensis]|uniref:Pyruvate dehydrogenase E1 component alpha subunit n=1 Tax=Streptomyces aidingensis TaxID=910347 RepID=A0A1I1QZU5_9ACTN|nr:pyruvate dehydrogenase (acetyl-transferring) E1 component subunit alpha [Streptomyces aidingensis]SFD27502.1 pyruvate dehydrogenase E1 component alpha subunit [Streptomyces aidingensis]